MYGIANIFLTGLRKIREHPALTVLSLAAFAMTFTAGWFAGRFVPERQQAARFQELRLGGDFRFINPLLECDVAQDALENELLRSFRDRVAQFIGEQVQRTTVSHVSVYFREMNNGHDFGIHESEKFAPASLVKIPLMMAYFKAAETDPELFSRRVQYRGGTDETATQQIKPAVALQPGSTYTVEDLIRASIIHSDNNAYFLLFGSLNPRVQRKVYADLGLESPKGRSMGDYVTVGEYAAFFRILFNASYLTREQSEKALGIMSEVDFTDGLVAGVPPGVAVAHKFGEWSMGDSGEIKQLHDCGIIYYPGHPYLLCVMTRGTSFDYLRGTIRGISRITFQEVDQRYGE